MRAMCSHHPPEPCAQLPLSHVLTSSSSHVLTHLSLVPTARGCNRHSGRNIDFVDDARQHFDSYCEYFNIQPHNWLEKGNSEQRATHLLQPPLHGAMCSPSHLSHVLNLPFEPCAQPPFEPCAHVSQLSHVLSPMACNGPQVGWGCGAMIGACPWKLAMYSGLMALWDFGWDQGAVFKCLVVPGDGSESLMIQKKHVERAFGLLEMLNSVAAIMGGHMGASPHSGHLPTLLSHVLTSLSHVLTPSSHVLTTSSHVLTLSPHFRRAHGAKIRGRSRYRRQ